MIKRFSPEACSPEMESIIESKIPLGVMDSDIMTHDREVWTSRVMTLLTYRGMTGITFSMPKDESKNILVINTPKIKARCPFDHPDLQCEYRAAQMMCRERIRDVLLHSFPELDDMHGQREQVGDYLIVIR